MIIVKYSDNDLAIYQVENDQGTLLFSLGDDWLESYKFTFNDYNNPYCRPITDEEKALYL